LDKAKLARVYNKLVDSKEDFKNEIDIIAKKVNAQKEAKKIAKTKALEAEKDEDDISEEGQGSGSADFGGDDGEEGDGEEEGEEEGASKMRHAVEALWTPCRELSHRGCGGHLAENGLIRGAAM